MNTATAPNKNRRILIVDDNESIHNDFRKILGASSAGGGTELEDLRAALLGATTSPSPRIEYEIESAFQGQQGLTKVQESLANSKPFALVFVDMRMPPGWDGLETIEHLWREDPDLQVVICSAYSDHSWETIVKQLGAVDNLLILKKPFDTAEITQLACALTEKWSLAREARAQREGMEQIVADRTRELREANEKLEKEVAHRQTAEERLRHDALHDPLTGLANRSLLMDRIQHCLTRTQRNPEHTLGVIFLDLDNFKLINDTMGHRVGDELLIEVSKRLTQCLRTPDTVGRLEDNTTARLGGDEFVVLLDDIHGPQDAVRVAERILQRLSEPFRLHDRDIVVSSSLGIAIGCRLCTDAHSLLRNADTAMYRAKHSGKACHAVYDESMYTEALNRLELENELRVSIEKRNIAVHYQPIIGLESGEITGFEALARWRQADQTLVMPDNFIPVAEETGLIVPLGRLVLEESCRWIARWNAGRDPSRLLSINVNVSRKELLDANFMAELHRVVSDTGIQFAWLNLEMTESTIISKHDAVHARLLELKKLGIQVHMDDFGTGYSSLSCLQRYPIDQLKIDRAFIKHLEKDRDHTAVVHAVISLARNLRIGVTAEGIETHGQLMQVMTMECDHVQGYYFSPPVEAEDATRLLDSHPHWLPLASRELTMAGEPA